MSSFDVAIVIVNWNSGEYLRECLSSIEQEGSDLRVKTIVVDNASSDGSQLLADKFSEVELVLLAENVGFAKACNIGARRAGDAEFFLFLNPDARLEEGVLLRVVDFMRQDKSERYGICGVALVDDSGRIARSCSRFPTPSRIVFASIGIDRLFRSAGAAMSEWDHSFSRDVDQVIGAFFFVRSSLFSRLSGFDERYFVYFEEVDFSLRASRLGFRTRYLSDTQAFHAGGGTSRNVKATRLFYSLRSRLLFSQEHFTQGGRLVVLVATWVVEPVSRVLLCIASRRWGGIREIAIAYRLLITSTIL